jgi:hypothetical protein
MDVRTRFRTAVFITVIGLILFLIPLNTLSSFIRGNRIGLYNLLIDIAAGVFTVWGLYWAASEFAEAQVRPDLRLIIGAEAADQQGIDPLRSATDALIGRDSLVDGNSVSQVVVGLFLENDQPKAARFVRVTLRLRDVPRPLYFRPIDQSFKYKMNTNVVIGEAIFIQFGEDLLVYKGDGVQLGNICIAWQRGVRPERIALVAGLYSLDSKPRKDVVVSRPIHWLETRMSRREEEPIKDEGKNLSNRVVRSFLILVIGSASAVAIKHKLTKPRGDAEEN